MKRLIFIIFIMLFMEADDISSIYKVEGYNSATPIPNIDTRNLLSFRVIMIQLCTAKSEDKYIFLLVHGGAL